MRWAISTEVDVSLEQAGYILIGNVDLLLGCNGDLGLLGLRTSPRPTDITRLIAAYERQLRTCAPILERRDGGHIDSLPRYWTAEAREDDGPTDFPYGPTLVAHAGLHLDEPVRRLKEVHLSLSSQGEKE
jgi:hypothetical protein